MIHVFDALGTFTADTSQLDQFTIKLEQGLTGASQKAASATIALKAAQEEFRASITAVNAEGGKTTENMLRLADAEQQLALAAAAARQEHAALKSSLIDAGVAAEKTAVSMHEARGEAMLLGEAFGIHLPRHVTSFLASIPGISEALSAAFSATAVLFLIDAVVKGAEKLSDWVAETFIFTDAMKKETATIAETNKAILAQIDLYNRAEEAIKEFGLTGSTLTKSKMDELTEAIDKNKDALRNAENQLYGLRNGFVDVVGDAGQFENKVNQLTSAIKTQNEQMDLLQRQHDQEQTDEIIRAENERISAAKTASSARISVSESEALLKLAITGGNYSQLLAIQNKAEEQQLHNDTSAMAQRIAALVFEGDRTKGERQKLSADIEKLIDDHNNKVRAIYAKAWQDLREISKEPIPLITEVPPGMETISNAITQGFDQAKAAAQSLGITLRSDLDSSLSDSFQHYDKLTQLLKQGVVTQKDVSNAYIALIKQELDFAKATGASTEAVQKLEKELARLTGQDGAHIEAFGRRAHLTLQNFKTDLHSGVDGIKELEEMGRQAFEDLTRGLENAVAAAIMGADGFGKALEKATAEALSSLAAQALVKALFYTAEGFAALAGFADYSASQYFTAAGIMAGVGAATGIAAHALAGAADSGSSSAATGGISGPASNSPNVNAGSGPSQVVNVTHFAAGGIATSPMLAMIAEGGSASEEAIIPLHDRDALDKIAAAFMEPIQRLAHMSPNLSIPASMLYPESGSVSRHGQSGVGSTLGFGSKQEIQELTKAIKAGTGEVHVHLHGSLPAMLTEVNHLTKTGRVRLHSTSTDKTIKKA